MITRRAAAFNILLTCAVFLLAVLYLLTGSILAKAGASICFAAIGLINFFITKDRLGEYRAFSVFLLCGLFLAMAGDIVINFIFIAGAAVFAAGHIFFLTAQLRLCPPDRRSIKRDIICAAGLFLVNLSIIMFAPMRFREPATIAVCVVYALIISAMTGKAVSNCIGTKTRFSGYMLLGTGLFMISDILLVLYAFTGKIEAMHYVSLTVYYIAEVILADSFLLLARYKERPDQ
jgi:hypothetical protein